MVRKNAAVGAYALTLLAIGLPARSQEPGNMSHGAMSRMLAHASKPADYARLSQYFHRQEQINRVKAQWSMDDYAGCARNFLMSPKFPTRADQDRQLFDYYARKADDDAKLAAKYDSKLVALGIKLPPNSDVISVQQLQKTPATVSVPVNAALDSTVQPPTDKHSKT